jgi:DHA1 family bicyclomycin/chloramphenicol resistance-like MFS transporter
MHDSLKVIPEHGPGPGLREFIALMAFSMSLVALSIDAMLPAFPEMSRDLLVANANDVQLIISLLFIGLAIGQLFYGPVSDSVGRKPAIYFGFFLFILGSLLSMVATSYTMMLAGRFLQGVGAAGPRTIAVALIRDRYHGSAMARVMSFIMTVFILVPILAPSLGQGILFVANWRSIFAVFVFLAVITMIWLAIRQPETLPPEYRKPFTARGIISGFRVVLGNRTVMAYTLVTGCISGAFFGYLNVCQQIFQVQYDLGVRFPLYFALLAFSVGVASLLNSSLVMRFGMHALANWALRAMTVISLLFLAVVWLNQGHPPLWLFMDLCLALFFCIGVLFGNLNSIAMEPLGHVAGTAAAVIGSVATLVAVGLGYLIGTFYNGTLYPMAIGFVVLGASSVMLTLGPESRRAAERAGKA